MAGRKTPATVGQCEVGSWFRTHEQWHRRGGRDGDKTIIARRGKDFGRVRELDQGSDALDFFHPNEPVVDYVPPGVSFDEGAGEDPLL